MPDTVTIGGKKYHLTEVEDDGEQVQEAVKEAKKAAKDSKGEGEEAAVEAAKDAAKEEGMSEADAKKIAVAVVAELKEGGYLEESGESGDSETDAKGDKETQTEGSEGVTQSSDSQPESTHRWYKK